jgi:type IV pilus assembly protein PilN
MIKINLIKGISVGANADFGAPDVDSGKSLMQRKALVNLVIIFLGPAILLMLEDQILTEKRAAIAGVRNALVEVEEKNSRARSAVEETRRFRDDQGRLEAQIQSIDSIKKNRRRELKLLEYLQKSVPEKVWLETMEINETKVAIRGLAVTDADLTQFMDSLSRSAFLREVSLQRSQETNNAEYGILKQFELACLMESSL